MEKAKQRILGIVILFGISGCGGGLPLSGSLNDDPTSNGLGTVSDSGSGSGGGSNSGGSGNGGSGGGPTCTSAASLIGVTPQVGSGVGGDTIQITGTGFQSCDVPTAISIGGVACTSPTFVSSTEISCTTGVGKGGYHDVQATFSAGTQTLSKSFTYHFRRSFLNNAAAASLNRNATRQSFTRTSLATINGKLYASWGEYAASSSTLQLRVAVNSGTDASPSWTFIDGNAADAGLNNESVSPVSNPYLFTLGSDLYVVWTESILSPASGILVRVKKYNGNDSSPSWSWVGSAGGNDGLNYDRTRNAAFAECIGFSAKIYCGWQEGTAGASQVRVKRFDGTTWDFVDGGAAIGINKDSSKAATGIRFIVNDSKLYAFWAEQNVGGTITSTRVAVYNGNDSAPSWTFVDGNGVAGIAYDTARQNATLSIFPTIFKSQITMAFAETDGTLFSIRVFRYNGNDSSPLWTRIDGGGTRGIYKSASTIAGILGVVHDRLTLITREGASDATTTFRIASFNDDFTNPSWRFTDGDLAAGVSHNSGVIYTGSPFGALFLSDRVYATWVEFLSGARQTRVLKIE